MCYEGRTSSRALDRCSSSSASNWACKVASSTIPVISWFAAYRRGTFRWRRLCTSVSTLTFSSASVRPITRRLKLPLHLPEQRPLRWGGLRPHPFDRHRIAELAFDRLTERPDLPLHSRTARQAPVLTPDPILIRALDLLERLLGRRRQTRDRDRRRRARLPLGLNRQPDGASVMRLPLPHLGHKARR